jgi:HPt (histidine-containing phosphotransfer) domain-containing protein
MYDLTTIKRISKNDNAVISKYIRTFIDNSEEELKIIAEYMAANKWNDIAEVLHKMKTSVAYFGMNDIEELVIHTEANIKNNIEKSMIRGQIEEINRLLSGAFLSLQKEIDSLAKS